jgi:hypothetical protein
VRISNTARDASWFQASYNNQSNPTGTVALGAGQSRDDVLDGWMYRQAITVSKDVTRQNPGDAGANLADFPIPIQITNPKHALFSHAASPEGRDIVFTSGDGVTRLSYELEYYDSADGSRALYAWVQSPLSADADTLMYMYFGGSEQDNSTATATWDNHYKLAAEAIFTRRDFVTARSNSQGVAARLRCVAGIGSGGGQFAIDEETADPDQHVVSGDCSSGGMPSHL